MATPATNPAPENSNNSDRTTDEDLNFNKDAIFDPAAVDADAPATKRPRGRPPGSKNKPKPPSFVTVDPSDAFRSHIMEIAAGADVAASLAAYARAHQSGVAVLHATGSVAGAVAFRHASPFKGHFDIVSLRGTIFPENVPSPSALTLFLASGPAGNVIGGVVNGPLIAAGPVMVTAATFNASEIEKLPLEGVSVQVSEKSDPGKGQIEGPGPGPGPAYNSGYNNVNLGMPSWGPAGMQYVWQPHQQVQQNGRRCFD